MAERYEVTVDTRIAELHGKCDAATERVNSAVNSMHVYAKDRRTYVGRRAVWTMTLADVLAHEPKNPKDWDGSHYLQARDDYNARAAELLALTNELAEAQKLYTGWSRFFLVANVGGHIHSSMSCKTCYPTTIFGWLPNLSGLTEADAVAEHGPRLCSVCYPSAPVEWTVGIASGKTYCAADKGATSVGPRYERCDACRKVLRKTNGAIRKHEAKA